MYNYNCNTAYSYSRAHAHLSAGLLSHAYNIQDAITAGCSMFDFMRGGEPYKYHLGGTNRSVYDLHIRLQ